MDVSCGITFILSAKYNNVICLERSMEYSPTNKFSEQKIKQFYLFLLTKIVSLWQFIKLKNELHKVYVCKTTLNNSNYLIKMIF